MKILVRNLSRKTTEEELRVLFETYGEVTSLDLVLDAETGRSKGFGFVEMMHSREGQEAIKKLNGRDVRGNRIRVKMAEEKGVKKRHGG